MSVLSHWLAMGGYAAFVWPAYAIAAFVLGGLALYLWRQHQRSEQLLAQLQRQSGREA
jgi:heme exporter protein D